MKNVKIGIHPMHRHSAPLIFYDLDFDSDSDDIMDFSLLLALEARGECQIVGIANTSAQTKAAGAIYAVLNFWHRTAIPLGSTTSDPGTTSAGGGDYDTPLNNVMGVAGHQTPPGDFLSGANAYRTALAAATRKVVVVTTGGASSLDNFLNSAADGISPLTGLQLATAKIDRIYVTAGHWPSGAAVSDMSTGKTIWADIFAICPVPIIAVDVSIDGSQTSGGGGTVTGMPFDEPLRFAWVEYWNSNSPSNSRGFCGQFSIMFAVRGEAGLAARGGDNGQLTVNTTDGTTQWNSSPNQKQGYITDVNLIYPQASWPALVNALVLTPSHMSRASKITNGDFATNDLTGWTNGSTGTGTASGSTGKLVMVGTSSANRGRVSQQFTTVVGKIYNLAMRGTAGTYNYAVEKTLLGGDGPFTVVNQATTTNNKSVFKQWTADVTSYFLRLENVAAGGTVNIDDVGVYEAP